MTYIASIISFFLGSIITTFIIASLLIGTIVVYIPDQADEPPYLTAELERSISFVSKRKFVLLKVDVRQLNSQQ